MGAVNGITFGGSSVRLRWNTSAIGGVVSLELPKQAMKEELITLLGEQSPSVRTEGMLEIDKAKATLTGVGWMDWLAVLPDQYMNFEFPLTGHQRHATIVGSYSTILDRCRIVSKQNGKWGGDEKSTPVELEIQPMIMLERGKDGVWKTAGRRVGASTSVSPWAKALMF